LAAFFCSTIESTRSRWIWSCWLAPLDSRMAKEACLRKSLPQPGAMPGAAGPSPDLVFSQLITGIHATLTNPVHALPSRLGSVMNYVYEVCKCCFCPRKIYSISQVRVQVSIQGFDVRN